MNKCKADLISRCSFDCVVCRYDDYDNFKKKYDKLTLNNGNPIKKSFTGPLIGNLQKKYSWRSFNSPGTTIENYI